MDLKFSIKFCKCFKNSANLKIQYSPSIAFFLLSIFTLYIIYIATIIMQFLLLYRKLNSVVDEPTSNLRPFK